jgi:site-specific DNA-methyltransferase (adenine-specific)
MEVDLRLGDCLDVMAALADNSVDLILCDLPYGTTACKWDSVIPFDALWSQYRRIAKPNAAIVLTAAQPFTSALIMSNARMFRYELIWDKKRVTNPMLAKKQFLRQHENVVVFYLRQPTYNPQPYRKSTVGRMGKATTSRADVWDVERGVTTRSYENEFGYPRSLLLDIPVMNNLTADRSGFHPTQKPVALMEYLIRTYTNEGDTVLDNCMGSGTTGVACVNTGRRFVGIERDPGYFAIATNRISGAQASTLEAA